MKKIVLTLFFLTEFSLLLFSQVGQLDPGFGLNGIAVTAVSPLDDAGLKLCVLPDNSFVLAGSARTTSGDRCFAIVKYSIDGQLDPSFANEGIMIDDLGPGHDVINSVIFTGDNKFLAAGRSEQEDFDIVIARYDASGGPDPAFGQNGKVIIDYGYGDDRGIDVEIRNNKIFLASQISLSDSLYYYAIISMDLNGNLDPGFGNGGITTAGTGTGDCLLTDMVLQEDGKIILAGFAENEDNGNGDYFDLFIARFNTNGSPDNSFSGDGMVKISYLNYNDISYSVALQSPEKIVLCGFINGQDKDDILLVRLNNNGTIDPSFGSDGFVVTDLENLSWDYAEPSLIQPDGKIVIGGYTNPGAGTNYDVFVARYDPDGSMDSTFGTNGWSKAIVGPNTIEECYTLAFQSNYDILCAGLTKELSGGKYDFLVTRFIGDHFLGIPEPISKTNLKLALYPNPARTSTMLNFTLDEPDILNIELINPEGKMAASLVSGRFYGPGSYSQNINLSSIPAGIYFLKLHGLINNGLLKLVITE